MIEIIIPFGEREYQKLIKDLDEIHPGKKPTTQKIKTVIKSYLRDAKLIKGAKQRKDQTPAFLKKRYLTSRGNFITVKDMAQNHVFNAVRKMEREYRILKDDNGNYFTRAELAFPSLPGFAGYEDLVAALRWHKQEATNP